MKSRTLRSRNDLEKAQQIISLILEVLGNLGLPGVKVAKSAVEETARRLEERERQQKLAEALRQAEEDFRAAAQKGGWRDVADLICQLPMHDTPSFREALKVALEGSRSEPLVQALQALCTPFPLPPPKANGRGEGVGGGVRA